MTDITAFIEVHQMEEVGLHDELFIFILLGVVCALIGSLFVYVVSKLVLVRKYSGIFWFNNRFIYAMSAVFLCAVISFPTPFLQHGDKAILSQLLSPDKLSF